MHAYTVDSGLWRLHLQRRRRRCAARAHRLLPHARWFAGSPGQVYNVGAARRFSKHATDDVSTLMCVLAWVCNCVSPFSTNKCFSLSLLDTYVFIVLLVCMRVFLCQGVHRPTIRHSSEISEIVPAHTRVRAHAEITCMPLSCGGDECDADSLSLLIQSYIPTCILVCLCMYVFVIYFPSEHT